MASYSNTNYSNGFYDLTGIYFNPVSSSTSSIDITTLDERYLKLSGGTISNNLIITNSLDVQNSITLPTIGDVETEIQAKQDIIDETTNISLNTLSANTILLNSNDIESLIAVNKGFITDLQDDKQDKLTSSSNITTGTISSGNITVRSSGTLTAGTITASTTMNAPNYTITGTPTNTTHATTKNYVDTELLSKQDIINDGDLTIAKTATLQSSLTQLQDNIDDKQDIIPDAGLEIVKINLLQDILDNKQDDITASDDISVKTLSAVGVISSSTTMSALNYTITGTPSNTDHAINKGYVDTIVEGLQPTIGTTSTTGILSIAQTDGLQTALDNKQDDITADTDLTLNSITTNALVVSHSLSVDSRKYFDTIVIRRPTGITGEATGVDFYIALRELQVWIAGSNILHDSPVILTSYFANWAVDKAVDLGVIPTTTDGTFATSNLYNNVISRDYDTHSKESNSTADIALIIKDIPLTLIETIQALVLYNRNDEFNDTTIGLAIELYNSTEDPTYTEILATTSVITTASLVYRFDFDDIGSYSSFATGESLTNIIREEDATNEVVSVAESPTEMLGGLSVGGDLTITGSIVNTSLSNNLSSIQTQVDALANFTGGGVNFRATRTTETTISATQILPFNSVVFDTESGYDTTGIYTIALGGTYIFTLSVEASTNEFIINLVRDRSGTEVVLQQLSNGVGTPAGAIFYLTTLAEVELGDEIFGRITQNSVVLTLESSFSGFRISN